MQKTEDISKKDGRKFGLLMSGFCLLFGILIPLIKNSSIKLIWIYISILFFIFTLFFPLFLFKIRFYWIKLGNVLGHINSTIIFSIIFFMIVTPLSLFFKLIGRDLLKMKYKNYQTTWTNKNQISNFEDIY